MKERELYPRPKLVSREQAHRRALLLGIGVLILLVLSPLFSHHVVRGTEVLLAGKDHLGALCLVALHTLMEPVHYAFHLLFFAGLLYACWDRLRAWKRARSVLAALEVESPAAGSAVSRAALAVGVDPGMVRVVRGLPTPAFTVGWLRPRIYMAGELEERLNGDQLAAVLAHEGAHAARRDPLRLSLLRFLTCTLFWIPALRRLADDVADEAEVQADDAAAAGRPLVLASAIVALAQVRPAHPVPQGAVGFHRPDILERRVRRLLGQEPLPGSHLTRRSLLGASVALGLVLVSGAIMAHPLPTHEGGHAPEHCQRHVSLGSLHLFCLDAPLNPTGEGCPHVYD